MKKISFLAFIVLFGFSIKAQVASRLTAFAKYNIDTLRGRFDTGGYKYSFGRGGEILYGIDSGYATDFPFILIRTMDFETQHTGITKFDSAWEKPGSGTDSVINTQVFDRNNNIIYASSYKEGSGIGQKIRANSYTYDANNNIISEIDSVLNSGLYNNVNEYTYAYDSHNNLISKYSSLYNNAQLSLDLLFVYDSYNNLIFDTTKGWNYTYSIWIYTGTVNFLYTGSTVDSFINYYAGGPTYKCSYYFSTANDTMIVTAFYDNDISYLRIINVYDANHNKILTLLYNLDHTYDPFDVNSKIEWTYNSFNQVTSEKSYTQDPSGVWTLNYLYRYYYQTYNPSFVNVTNSPRCDLKVFPTPARDIISIKLQWDIAEPFIMSIYDMQGKLLREWEEPAINEYQKTVSLSGLTAGDYLLKAYSCKEQTVTQFSIMH